MNVAAVDEFSAPIREELEQHHGGVFTDSARAEKPIEKRGDFRQALTGAKLRMDNSLHGCGHDRGWQAFARNIRDGHADAIFELHGIKEVAANLVTWNAFCTEHGIGNDGHCNG